MDILNASINVLGYALIGYVLLVWVLYGFRKPVASTPAEVPEVFSEEEFAEILAPAPMPSAAAKAMPSPAVLVVPVADADSLDELSIRQLKKLASGKVRGYSNLAKPALIQALRDVGVTA